MRALIGGIHSNRIIQDVIESGDPDECERKMFEQLESLGAQELLQEIYD
jgi:hypothetical protein